MAYETDLSLFTKSFLLEESFQAILYPQEIDDPFQTHYGAMGDYLEKSNTIIHGCQEYLIRITTNTKNNY